jgi:hypothetical protein
VYGPPGGPSAFGAPRPMQGEYEFNETENQTIAAAARWARALGIVLVVNGALMILNCNIIGAALNIWVGAYFISGGGSLDSVVKTQGNDVANMMQALTKLATAFKIRVIITLVAVGLLVLVFGAVAMMAASGAMSR